MRLAGVKSLEELEHQLSQPPDPRALEQSEPPDEEYELAEREDQEVDRLLEKQSPAPVLTREKTDELPISTGPGIISAVMLVLAAIWVWPYGFYLLLRWVVFGTAAYFAVRAWARQMAVWKWVMVSIALFFNPIIPMYLDRSTWRVLDFMTAVVFVVWLVVVRRKKSPTKAQGGESTDIPVVATNGETETLTASVQEALREKEQEVEPLRDEAGRRREEELQRFLDVMAGRVSPKPKPAESPTRQDKEKLDE